MRIVVLTAIWCSAVVYPLMAQDRLPITERVSLGRVRVVAGEAPTLSWTGRSAIASLRAVTTSPALEFPFQLSAEDRRLNVVIPPATPPGEYSLIFQIEGRSGGLSVRLEITLPL